MWRDNLHFWGVNSESETSKRETSYDVSEFTRFMDEFLKKHPEVVEDRKKGWSIYWDKSVDLEELEKTQKDSVPEKPYHYE